jgi:hypothetical protein
MNWAFESVLLLLGPLKPSAVPFLVLPSLLRSLFTKIMIE